MKTKNQQQITVSPEMMQVFRQLLFAEGGVNLDTIANDLFFGNPTDYDMCRLACAFKGLKVKMPEPIYRADYKCYKVFTPVAFSFIGNNYLCEVNTYTYRDGEWKERVDDQEMLASLTFHQVGISFYYTDLEECKKHISGMNKED